jgi:hypothetical protein
MANPPPKQPKGLDERTARVRCHQLVGSFIPYGRAARRQREAPGGRRGDPDAEGRRVAWDGVHSSPAIVELDAAHADLAKKLARLEKSGLAWPAIMVEMIEAVRKYRMPTLDGMRERNGLTQTFGEQTVKEIVR